VPARHDALERVLEQRLLGHERRQSRDPHSGQRRRVERVGVDAAQRRLGSLDGERLADAVRHARIERVEGQLAHEARHHRLVPDEIARMLRPPAAVEVLGRRAGDDLGTRKTPRHEAAVERTAPLGEDRDVVVLVDVLDRAGHRELERHTRMARSEGLQVLGELMHGERRRAEYPQMAARLGHRRRGERLGFLDFRQHVAHALEVGLADVGEGQAPGGPMDQACAQMLLEIGDEPRDHGGREVQRARGRGEAAFIDHPGEDPHRVESVHGRSYCCDLRNAQLKHARFIDAFAMPNLPAIDEPTSRDSPRRGPTVIDRLPGQT
jgi:hypothetical protein